MGLDPNSWGPPGWHFIHAVALTFPNNPTEEQKSYYQSYFLSLANVLPCELCRQNFKDKLITTPPPYDGPANMFKWTVDIHNQVNKANNKPELSYDQAFNEFKKNAEKYRTDNTNLPAIKSNPKLKYHLLAASGIGLAAGGLITKNRVLSVTGLIISGIAMALSFKKPFTSPSGT